MKSLAALKKMIRKRKKDQAPPLVFIDAFEDGTVEVNFSAPPTWESQKRTFNSIEEAEARINKIAPNAHVIITDYGIL